MHNKRIISVFTLAIIAIALAISLYVSGNKAAAEFELIEACFDKRSCTFKENMVLIGNNEKELGNLYYDIQIKKENQSIKFRVNKMWKTKYNELLYEQDYVQELASYIQKIIEKPFGACINKQDMRAIQDSIIQGYINAKENVKYESAIKLKMVNIKFYSLNYELVIEVTKV